MSAPSAHHDPAALSAEVVEFCLQQGFALVGVCAANPTAHAEALDAWIAAGKHADMAWLADSAPTRKDPALELPGARSIIMVGDQYADGRADPLPPPATPTGRVARYARGRDYHWFIKRRLHGLNDALRERYPQHQFRTFVDTAPVLEREHAARAGLGWIGKHTLLIHPRLGSYVLLGGTLTTMEIAPTTAGEGTEGGAAGAARSVGAGVVADRCGTCTRCIDACPTEAITPYSVDASRCISYLTIEREGPIEPGLAAQMGDWVFGCDVCQEVCPFNSPREGGERPINPAYVPAPGSAAEGGRLGLRAVMGWSEEDKRRAVEGTAMKRATLAMLQRNARIALDNARR